ncbi:DUF2946 family protein [Bradyrhizobium liaoningense]|uniref:DUF2946 family protein n=1 Tax=Bradyrhizobium liaoningense TaxID=43992 RepID=UPI001BA9214F|nr:DUF2946 family protein [Bradyrhizobium liaoningense]MBR0715766.1 DUF2946 family protein [Bradyrhizobium liaoningense]
MRARLQKFLPIVLIALAMQVLAPIAACWAAGAAVADPLQNAVICHTSDSSGSGPADQTGAHAGACAMCCVAQASASLDSPQPTFFGPVRHAVRVAWHDVTGSIVTSHGGSNAQARAPPQFS